MGFLPSQLIGKGSYCPLLEVGSTFPGFVARTGKFLTSTPPLCVLYNKYIKQICFANS